MMDPVVLITFGATIALALIAGVAFQVHAQAWAVSQQKRAIDQVDESLDLSRLSLEHSERALVLTETIVRNQEEMIRLLREIAGQDSARPGETGLVGVRMPHSGPPGQKG